MHWNTNLDRGVFWFETLLCHCNVVDFAGAMYWQLVRYPPSSEVELK